MNVKRRRRRKSRKHRSDMTDFMHGERPADPAAGAYRLLFPLAYIFTLVYIFSVPFENTIYVEGIGSISRAVGIPILAIWIWMLLLKQTIRKFVPFYIFSGLFVIWCSFSFLWSRHTDVVVLFLTSYVQLFLASYFIWLTLTDQNRCVRAMQVFLIGGCVAVGFVFWHFYTRDIGEVERGKRSGIEGVDFNELAMSISLVLPVAWYLATRATTGVIVRAASYVFMPLGILAIVMSGSRSGFASIMPTLLYVLLSLLYVGKSVKIIAGVAIVVSLVLVLQYVPEAQFARIMTFSEEIESGDVSGRGELWRSAIQIWLQNPLNSIVGIGIGGFGMEVGAVAHSTYLSILAETGLIGFVVFIFVLLSLLVAAMRAQREVRYMLVTILMVWGIGASTLTWEYSKMTWLVWSLIACISYAFSRNQIAKSSKRRS